MIATDKSIIICSDDFALTKGISEGILSLAEAGRLSATSAIVTTTHWPAQAKAVMRLRDRFAVGLHLNLTFGAPLGSMPDLAPDGVLPPPQVLIGKTVCGYVRTREIAVEIERQFDRFESEAGFPPDFIDSHHHVHILPVVRHAIVATLRRRYPSGGLLLRDPSDKPARIIRRRIAAKKALGAWILARGFCQLAAANGFLVNAGFSGFSTFGRIPYTREFDTFLLDAGPHHMIMCHPGFVDNELSSRDPIAHRRPEEYSVLSTRLDITSILWRPNRLRDALGCQWRTGGL
jgi:predicted glycoside hydrolase/deacetylase ChbG (UPF0249 family)